MNENAQSPESLTLARGRLFILLAAVLWSTSGAFTKVLTQPTWFGLNQPPLDTLHLFGKDFPIQIACYRVLFAALAFSTLLRPGDFHWRPMMLAMGVCFAIMNITFISAQALGTAANAILLQYSAPLWMYLACVFFLGEKPDRKNTWTLFLGMFGIAIIMIGGWEEGEFSVIVIALLSGFFYAGVILCLRALREFPAHWLTVWNHGVSALVLIPLLISLRPPTMNQFGVLFLFGLVQMSAAYWLMAKGLKVVSPQEAGTLTLLEPLLNPVWTYFIAGEMPDRFTMIGGAVILSALAWRYWPRSSREGT